MPWELNADISYCHLDEHLVFLDIDKDRYFQLSGMLERNFLDFTHGLYISDTDLSALAKHNILSWGTETSDHAPAITLPLPRLSVPEAGSIEAIQSISVISDVFTSVTAMHWRLKRHRLKCVLEDLDHYRHEYVMAHSANSTDREMESRVVEAASTFNRIRPYVPVTSRCLIDSLSMVRFLAKRGLPSRLVIAIACDPFSAHAWAQHDEIVLNDTVGNALAHMPIRVI